MTTEAPGRPYIWFNAGGRRRNFRRAFGHLKGKPATYLEIGVFRGESLEWVCENILTHPESRAVGVDPWAPGCMGRKWSDERIADNYRQAQERAAKFSGKVTLSRWTSAEWFAIAEHSKLWRFDAIYLDGEHDYEPLGADFTSAWRLLKPGGALVIDDYKARKSAIPQLVRDLEPEYGASWQVLFTNYQIGLRKLQ